MSFFHWVTLLGPGVLLVQLPEGFELHARPAALISQVVARHAAPVVLDIGGHTCRPDSLIELLVTVRRAPEQRTLVFRGPTRPLHDLHVLFEHGLAEDGLAALPGELDYLRELGD